VQLLRTGDGSDDRTGPDPVDPTDVTDPTDAPTGAASTGSLAAVMALVGGAAALVAARPLADNSFLTHLATGRLILDQGVPSENPFLFTGTSFPVPSWWWSILLGLADDLGGASAIRLLTAVVAGLVGASLVRLTRPGVDELERRPGVSMSLLSAVVPSVLALVCVMLFLSGRPHIAGYLLLALALVVWNEQRSPWWLVPIFACWVNVHGSWLFGIAVLVLLGAARAIDDRRLRARDGWNVLAAVGGAILGGALYPTAFEIILLPTRQFGDPVEREALESYQEWSRVPFDQPILYALLALGGVALLGAVRTRRWAAAGAVVALVLMGWSGSRLVPIAAVSLVPFAAMAMRDVGTLALPSGRAARASLAAGLLLCVATVAYSFSTESYDLEKYPVAAVDWLEQRELVADDARVVSHDYVGNYLEWRFGDRANAYVDDRPDALTLLQYQQLLLAEDGWRAELDEIDAPVVLWSADGDLAEELADDPDWIEAVELDDYRIFCRSDIAQRCG
jgi:MFS family permease